MRWQSVPNLSVLFSTFIFMLVFFYGKENQPKETAPVPRTLRVVAPVGAGQREQ
jgi:hypothetical protein